MSESNKAIFLSYAKQDAEAAARICAALQEAGLEVWFDQSELRGGDAWDAAIRKQIKTCALMIPVISANTQGRAEGYFRLEWKLAIDRSHLMSHDRAFLIPVVIDDTAENDERVPEKFREVQWTRLPDGRASASFVARMAKLLEHDAVTANVAPPAAARVARLAHEAIPAPPPAAAPSKRPLPLGWLAVAGLVLAVIGAWASRHAWLHPASVIAYSHEDRRMTYAVLPFQASGDDAHAAQIATATGDEILALLEERKELVNVVPGASAQQAAAHESGMKKLARELDVHFLVRGTVAHKGDAYSVTVVGIDGDSERVLTTQSLMVPKDELTPHWRDEAKAATGELVAAGIQAEVKRARDKPVDELDVRDLTFRAMVDWRAKRDSDGKAANSSANELLDRALAIAPDDPYALRSLATVNLCDCVNAWSTNPDEQKAIGAAAMEKYLRINPDSLYMLGEKANLYQVRLRWEESLVIADTMLAREPTGSSALSLRATALLRLNRLKEAQDIAEGLLSRHPSDWTTLSTVADIYYAQGDYARAAQLSQKAAAQMSEADLKDRVSGVIRLTLIASEARLGHDERAKAAWTDFTTTLPEVKSISAIKKWMHPSADLADFEPLYEGLRLAGVGS
ncbi:MAG TPA: TIR domain-containing protein [Steroidobacteraceae bacterium]|jgi:tetratricopeptide (TPR) repeat protein